MFGSSQSIQHAHIHALTCDSYIIILHSTKQRENFRVLPGSPPLIRLFRSLVNRDWFTVMGFIVTANEIAATSVKTSFLFASDRKASQMTPFLAREKEKIGCSTVVIFLATPRLPCFNQSRLAFAGGHRSYRNVDNKNALKNTRSKCKARSDCLLSE